MHAIFSHALVLYNMPFTFSLNWSMLRMHAPEYCDDQRMYKLLHALNLSRYCWLDADDAWVNVTNMPQSMESMFISFGSLGRISARMAARLADAGVLPALIGLAEKQRKHSGQAAGWGAGADMGDEAALPEGAAVECFATYARSIPQVHRWGMRR